jgi:hypothetical protein
VFVLLFGVTLLGTLCSTTALAQRLDKKTSVTFSQPIEIPGAGAQVLPAGSYVFKLFDSMSDRHIVQVFNKDETHIYATILTIPNQRLRATDKTVMTFAERAAGEPQAIRAWFYPGDRFGQEFVYPKKRAVELAKVTHQPVLYVPAEVAVNFVAPVRTVTEPPVVALREVTVSAIDPAGEDVSLAQVVEPPPVQIAGLPKTAGNVPLLAAMGLLAMTLGFSVRAWCAAR